MNGEEAYPAQTYRQGGFSGGRCPYCGNNDIVTGLKYNLNAEVGPFGLSYRALGPFSGTERLYADLCRDCGTVVRSYVRKPKQNWIQK